VDQYCTDVFVVLYILGNNTNMTMMSEIRMFLWWRLFAAINAVIATEAYRSPDNRSFFLHW